MTLNLIIVGLFVANLVLRTMGNTAGLPFVLSIIGVGLLLVSGWFGWELIYRQGGRDLARDRDPRARASRRRVTIRRGPSAATFDLSRTRAVAPAASCASRGAPSASCGSS